MITLLEKTGYWLLTSLMLVILGAHYFRGGEYGFALVLAGILFFFFCRKDWQTYTVSFFLFYGFAEWVLTSAEVMKIRMLFGQDYVRAVSILLVVALLTLGCALWVYARAESNAVQERGARKMVVKAKAWIFFSVFVTAYWLDRLAPLGLLAAGRFAPFLGTVQIFCISCYAVWVFSKLENPKTHNRYRPIIWIVFSLVFFAQLFLGMAGMQKFLMTGRLHFPVPGFIVFGAVYKAAAGFMFGLVLIAVLLTGSGWCSHLCYFGAFDAWAGRKKTVKPMPEKPSARLPYLRFAVLFAGMGIAFLLAYADVPFFWVLVFSWAYVLLTVGVIVFFSRKWRSMMHCSAFCPMGAVISCLAKISPWRIKILPQCDGCGVCEKICRYRAVSAESRSRGKVLHNCTLCLDCMNVCRQKAVCLEFAGIKADREKTRIVFLSLITVIHAVFLAFAKV